MKKLVYIFNLILPFVCLFSLFLLHNLYDNAIDTLLINLIGVECSIFLLTLVTNLIYVQHINYTIDSVYANVKYLLAIKISIFIYYFLMLSLFKNIPIIKHIAFTDYYVVVVFLLSNIIVVYITSIIQLKILICLGELSYFTHGWIMFFIILSFCSLTDILVVFVIFSRTYLNYKQVLKLRRGK